MSNDFQAAEKKLNQQFYADVNEELMEDLHRDIDSVEEAEALAAVTGISDRNLLMELVTLKVSAETFAAFRMAPLVAVAWSDGQLQKQEREVLLDAAARKNIQHGSPAYRLLDEWLDRRPPEELMRVWLVYVEEICDALSNSAVSVLRAEVIGQAEMVAQAAGGFLGIGATNQAEKSVLTTIRNAFPREMT
ncbi:hypothetical protein FF011L_39500 [Roseimaritima multifibrata]|uniref:Tellurite resistance protein TerB n=1 Tax=Roseimaritima multifibrata TaxID=1930274 RepID=A0A517MJV9_9BACT|nr:hypothetical protein [Roseimaritima multifibrata]QDS95163.1 hypothetical protein FF011L_39500 [Roseimaritima multifibrata]